MSWRKANGEAKSVVAPNDVSERFANNRKPKTETDAEVINIMHVKYPCLGNRKTRIDTLEAKAACSGYEFKPPEPNLLGQQEFYTPDCTLKGYKVIEPTDIPDVDSSVTSTIVIHTYKWDSTLATNAWHHYKKP